MRRPPSRRDFCVVAGCGLVVGACGSSSNGGDDLAAAPADLAASGGDLLDPGCADGNGLVHVGPVTQFQVGTATFYFCSHMFVCRDAGGLYALTSICTHEGCDVEFKAPNHDFECPCHQSVFDLNGNVVVDPATKPLQHLAVSLDADGNVVVDINTNVASNVRVGPGTGGTD